MQSGPDTCDKLRLVMTFLTILVVTEIVCSVTLVLEEKTVKEIPEFIKKFLVNNFALSNSEDNISSLLNRGHIADLSLFRTLLVIRQKSWQPSFWKVMDSFVLLAYESFAASRPLLPSLLACLNFTLVSDLFCWHKQKRDFY